MLPRSSGTCFEVVARDTVTSTVFSDPVRGGVVFR
jgi:hypothetical protein